MADIGWGFLASCEGYGRVGDEKEDFIVVDYSEALSDVYSSHMHASHAMLFARNDAILWDLYAIKAAVLRKRGREKNLEKKRKDQSYKDPIKIIRWWAPRSLWDLLLFHEMQMRFDGLLGFPGGLVDPGETPVKGLNRELSEEIGLDISRFSLTDKDQVVSFFNEKKKLVLHFYGLEVPMPDFVEIERKNLTAPEYGIETLGVLRPPIYTMGDGYRGLPAFLSNSFAGNAKEEFLIGLEHFKILSKEEIQIALNSLKEFKSKQSNSIGVTVTKT